MAPHARVSARTADSATVVSATRLILAAPFTQFQRTMALAAVLKALAAQATTQGALRPCDMTKR